MHMAVCQNLVPLVNLKIAGKWMFIPLKKVLVGIDPYPHHPSCIHKFGDFSARFPYQLPRHGRLGAVWFRWPHSASASWRSLGANLKHWSAGAKSVVLEAVPQLHQGMKKERLEAEVVNIWGVNICTLRTLCPLSTSFTLYTSYTSFTLYT